MEGDSPVSSGSRGCRGGRILDGWTETGILLRPTVGFLIPRRRFAVGVQAFDT